MTFILIIFTTNLLDMLVYFTNRLTNYITFVLLSFCHRNIYYAFVNSHVAYGIGIYANTRKTLLHKLHILNSKLLHILQKQAPLTPIYQVYSTLSTLLYICCIIQKYWNWYIVQCFMFVIYQKCIVTMLLLTNLCVVML